MFKKITTMLTILLFVISMMPPGMVTAQQRDSGQRFGDFVYEINPADPDIGQPESIRIISYEGENRDVAVPNEINGIKVTGFMMKFAHPEKVKKLGIPDNLEKLGGGTDADESVLFAGLTALEEITVGSANRFYCSEQGVLYDIDGETASEKEKEKILVCYPREKNGKSYTVGGKTKYIAKNAFYKNKNLKTVKIGKSVKYLDGFQGSGIEKVTFSKRNGSVLHIQNNAFQNCQNMKNITLPKGTAGIGEAAWKGCRGITSVMLPDSVKSIGKEAFMGCHSLKKVTLKKGLEEIGKSAFWACKSLKSISVPYSVEKIGVSAFRNCPVKIKKWSELKKRKDRKNRVYYEVKIGVKKGGKITYYKISDIGTIQASKETMRIKKGMKKQLVTKIYDTDYRYIGTLQTRALRYRSGNKKVASVNKKGIVTVKKKGTAIIHAEGYAGGPNWDYEVEIN